MGAEATQFTPGAANPLKMLPAIARSAALPRLAARADAGRARHRRRIRRPEGA
jgi:hypothetical protein